MTVEEIIEKLSILCRELIDGQPNALHRTLSMGESWFNVILSKVKNSYEMEISWCEDRSVACVIVYRSRLLEGFDVDFHVKNGVNNWRSAAPVEWKLEVDCARG